MMVIDTKDSSGRAEFKEKASIISTKGANIMANGEMAEEQEKELCNITMVKNTMENGSKILGQGLVLFIMIMEMYYLGNG